MFKFSFLFFWRRKKALSNGFKIFCLQFTTSNTADDRPQILYFTVLKKFQILFYVGFYYCLKYYKTVHNLSVFMCWR